MFERVIAFFKSRQVTVETGPMITVSYSSWNVRHTDLEPRLREVWEQLRKELDPRTIKEAKWDEPNFSEKRHEEITLDLEGVLIHLTGAEYPNPNYREPVRPEPSVPRQVA